MAQAALALAPSPPRPAPSRDLERRRKLLRHFDGQAVSAALRQAQAELASAPSYRCCSSLRAHIFQRIGWTFFNDDDPDQLAQAFPTSERDQIKRVLAACILLFGRERVSAPQGAR